MLSPWKNKTEKEQRPCEAAVFLSSPLLVEYESLSKETALNVAKSGSETALTYKEPVSLLFSYRFKAFPQGLLEGELHQQETPSCCGLSILPLYLSGNSCHTLFIIDLRDSQTCQLRGLSPAITSYRNMALSLSPYKLNFFATFYTQQVAM